MLSLNPFPVLEPSSFLANPRPPTALSALVCVTDGASWGRDGAGNGTITGFDFSALVWPAVVQRLYFSRNSLAVSEPGLLKL